MPIPVVSVLKLIALGSIKIVLLSLGALLVPIFTLRLVVGGTGESIRMTTQWMVEHGKMDHSEAEGFLQSLAKVQQADFTRAQARGLLFKKVKKSSSGIVNVIGNCRRWLLNRFGRNTA